MKLFSETHPSLTAYDRKVAPVYTEYDQSLVCTVAQIQKHTIDKVVLREKLWKWFNGFTSQFEGGVGEIPFGSDELYEGLKDFEKELKLDEK